MANTPTVPLVLLRNLPVFSGAPDEDMTLVAVMNNKESVRVSWDSLTAQFAVFSSLPTSTIAAGPDNGMAIGDSFYTYYNGMWGKTTRYTKNWEDLDGDTRFLLVNKQMDLSDEERANVQAVVGLKLASQSDVGLVKGSDSVVVDVDGTMEVPEASLTTAGITTKQGQGPAATVDYVDAKFNNIVVPSLVPATETELGCILASDTIKVGETGQASVPIAVPGEDQVGLVRLAAMDTYTDMQAQWAAPVALVEKIAEAKASEVSVPATTTKAGVVLPTGSIYLKDAEVGAIDTYISNTTRYGVVKQVDEIPDVLPIGEGLVPSLKAVKDYIDTGYTGLIEPSNLPYATATTRGAIISSATVRVSELGSNVGQAYVPTATASSLGVVRVQSTATESEKVPIVPSVNHTQALISSATKNIKSDAVKEAAAMRPTTTSYGMVRVVTDVADTLESSADVPTEKHMQAYVQQAITTAGAPSYANTTTYGVVRIVSAADESSSTMSDVPSELKMEEYVAAAIADIPPGATVGPATMATYGTVLVVPSEEEDEATKATVPSLDHMQVYVADALETVQISEATSAIAGSVRVVTDTSDTVTTQSQVPTDRRMRAYVASAVSNITIPTATAAINGTVRVVTASTDTTATQNQVPTDRRMQAYVASAVAGIGGDVFSGLNQSVAFYSVAYFSGAMLGYVNAPEFYKPVVFDYSSTSLMAYGPILSGITGSRFDIIKNEFATAHTGYSTIRGADLHCVDNVVITYGLLKHLGLVTE